MEIYLLKKVSQEAFTFKPSLFKLNDELFIFYHTESEGRRIDFFYIKSKESFESWTHPVQIAKNFAGSFFPFMVLYRDKLYVVWQSRPFIETETPVFDIYLSISEDYGNTWTDPVNLTKNSSGEDLKPFIKFANNRLCLIWESDRGGAWGIYYGTYDLSGKPLTEEKKINDSILNAKDAKCIFIGKDLYIFYLDERDGKYRVYYSLRSGMNDFTEEGPITQNEIDITNYYPVSFNNDIYFFCEDKRGIFFQSPDRHVETVNILPFENNFIGRNGKLISWKKPEDSSGIEGYCFSFNNKKIDDPEIVNLPSNILNMKLEINEEGNYYFHIRARDNAGNLSKTVTVPFIADLTFPPAPSIVPLKLDKDGYFNGNSITFRWSVDAQDILGYNYVLSHKKVDISKDIIKTYKNRLNFRLIKGGEWYFNIAALDRAKNVGATSHFRFRLKPIPVKPEEKKSLKIALPWIFSSETFKANPLLNILLYFLLVALLFITFFVTTDILIKYITVKKEVYMEGKEGYGELRKRRLGLRFKFSMLIGVLVLILTVGISVILSYVTVENEKAALSDQMMDKAKLSIENITNVAREGILNNDELFLLSVIAKTMENKDIKYSIILDVNNKVIAHSDINQIGKILNDEFTLNAFKSSKLLVSPGYNPKNIVKIYDLSNPITFTNKRIGTVRIGYSTDSIFETINENRKKSLYSSLIITVVMIIIGIIGAIIMASITIKPIKTLAKGANIIGGGNLEYKIQVTTRDEIGLLADEFNRMTGRLLIYQKEMEKKAKVDEQLEIARNIQQDLIPHEGIDIEGISIDGYYRAASEVGGDYYDFIEIDDKTYGLIISDVAGKGVPASLMMIMIRTMFRSLINSGIKKPAEAVYLINRTLVSDISSDRFATIMFGIFNIQDKIFRYTNAGYGPLLLYKKDKNQCILVDAVRGSIPIGVMADVDFMEENPIRLESGDAIILLTDGIHEARNEKEEEYGLSRLSLIIPAFAQKDAKEISNLIIEDVLKFAGDAEQYDDMALMVMKVK